MPGRRSLATESSSAQKPSFSLNADPANKPKPKATTPLRRSASASLPIRSNPKPTRGSIHPIITVATAERYILPRLRAGGHLPANSQALNDSWWVPQWPPRGQGKGDQGEVFVFANGSFVCWGLDESGARRFASEVIGNTPGIEVGSLKEAETEELEFVTDPSELGGASYWSVQTLIFFSLS